MSTKPKTQLYSTVIHCNCTAHYVFLCHTNPAPGRGTPKQLTLCRCQIWSNGHSMLFSYHPKDQFQLWFSEGGYSSTGVINYLLVFSYIPQSNHILHINIFFLVLYISKVSQGQMYSQIFLITYFNLINILNSTYLEIFFQSYPARGRDFLSSRG